MHITVHCPSCRSRFQLNEEMRGKRMRCPNAICREIFEVREDAPEPPPPAADPPLAAAEEPTVPRHPRRPPTPPEKQYVAGSIGDLVPFLSSEAAEEPASQAPAPAPPAEAPSWQDAPPVRRRPAEAAPKPPPAAPAPEPPRWQQAPPPVRKPAETLASIPPPAAPPEPPPVRAPKARKPKETLPPSAPVSESITPTPTEGKPAAPPEPPAKTFEPPPVRRKGAETLQLPAVPPPSPAAPPSVAEKHETSAPVRRSNAGRLIAVMVLFVIAVAGVGIWYGLTHEAQTEAELVEKAKKAYESGDFVKASGLYDQLIKNFGESDDIAEYRFRKDLCAVRRDVTLSGDWNGPLGRLRDFTKKYANDPLLKDSKESKKEVWASYWKLIDDKLLPKDTAKTIEEKNIADVGKRLGEAREARKEAETYRPETASAAELEKRIQSVADALALFEKVREFVAKVQAEKDWDLEKFAAKDRMARDLNLQDHPEVKSLLANKKADWLFGSNRFFPHKKAVALRPPAEDSARTLLVAPRVDPLGGPQLKVEGVVLALARGVLYALRERDGHVLWFVRVGIDTSTLPVRLPRGEANRELVLVLSSDTNTLTARDAQTGEAQWQYTLSAPCLGRPVLVGRRAYVPTIDGRVHEIEIVGGTVLGEFRLSLGLSGAGARQEGTNLLYFPADKDYLYVLDVDKKRCVAMLNTGHPSGSLRGDPIIVSDDGPAPVGGALSPPRYLILSMADGLDAMRLRAYRLPIEGVSHAPPLQPEPRVHGWSWFQPSCDGEKVVLTTDAGVLGLYGINQFQNQDQPLFPLFPYEIKLEGEAKQPGRAQVVHVADQDFWALAQGNLQQWRMGLGPEGQKAAAVWLQPLPLGSPLHAAQVSKNGDTLFVVTQSPARQACLATAVEAATGKVRWQRQLGLTVRGELIPLAGRIIALDQGGGLFIFDPEKDDPVMPPARGETSAAATHLLPNPDGKSVYVLARPGPGKLTVRRHSLLKKNAADDPYEFVVPAPLAGTPALGEGFLFLPLANGVLARQSLTAKTGGVDRGPHWRALHADADARGHVVSLSGDEVLVTDGSSGLLRVSWPQKQVWSVKAEGSVENRIVSAPLLLPDDMTPRVCVADAAGTLTLLDATKLKPIRRWALDGKITAGPFRRGKRIGCVVDRRTLVWLDPAQAKPLWKYTVAGDGIVGQPRAVGDTVAVADLSGRFLTLDAETGQPRGPGYTVKASVAPAASPVAFGLDAVFAPLTDGTILLLRREQLEKR